MSGTRTCWHIEQLDEEDLGEHKPKDKKEVYQILVEFQNEKELAKAMKEFAAKGYEAKRL
jgi:Na+-translocating ferredoxin:NAD+ oxidoreductase RnfG subunit